MTLSIESIDVHAKPHDAFLEEVHSFEFWFQSVEGYLRDRPLGISADAPNRRLNAVDREALTATLSTYCLGEVAALEGASGMIGFAPNRSSKIFLATQVADEARHLEVFLNRLQEVNSDDSASNYEQLANRSLLAFKKRLLEFVAAKDWEASVLAQNVILESMEYAAFQSHIERADPRTAEILRGVVKDERRHMGFGENELGRRLAATPHSRTRLQQIKQELDAYVLSCFEESLSDIGVPLADRPDVGRLYLETVRRLGFDS